MNITIIVIIFITLISKIIGFIRDIVLSYYFGATNTSDAYFISLMIPGIVAGFIGVGLTTAFIPIYTKVKQERNTTESLLLTNNILNITFLIYTVILIISLLYTEQLINIFAKRFDEDTLDLTIEMTRYTLFGMYLTGSIHILKGYLNVNNSFKTAELSILPLNIITIISYSLAYHIDLIILSIGRIVGLASQLLLIILSAWKIGYRYKYIIDTKEPYIKKMVITILPVILGTAIYQVNVIVDKMVASQIIEGGISALVYGNRINELIQGVFVLSLTTVIYPKISSLIVTKEYEKTKDIIAGSITAISIFLVPITFGIMVLSEPIVKLIYGRGEFDNNAVVLTSNALFYYSIGILGFAYREVLTRIFYSMNNTKTPMKNSIIGIIINIILTITLSKYMGLAGIAAATSISGMITALLLFIVLRKKIGVFVNKKSVSNLLKIILSSLAMATMILYFYPLMKNLTSETISLILSILFGGIFYFCVLITLKISEQDKIINNIKKKYLKNK